MASVHKRPGSPFFHAAFYLPNGTRTLRSTKQRKKAKAMEIALKWAEASRIGRENRLTESQARRVIGDIAMIANREGLKQYTVESFVKAWLENKLEGIAERSKAAYQKTSQEFLNHIGARKAHPVEVVTPSVVLEFKSALSKNVSHATVNQKLLIMRGCWSWGQRLSVVLDNPFKAVELANTDNKDIERRAFTLDELRILLRTCDTDWKTMVLIGLYTGQRLGDIGSLTHGQIDLEAREIKFHTQKTKRRMVLPICGPLYRHLMELPSSDDPNAPLMPSKSPLISGTMSRQFGEILEKAELVQRAVTIKRTASDKRRTQAELSFHSLRHTATSLLKGAGVSDAIAMEFIGHDSKSISREYTHIEQSSLRRAADLLPDITKAVTK